MDRKEMKRREKEKEREGRSEKCARRKRNAKRREAKGWQNAIFPFGAFSSDRGTTCARLSDF